MSENFYITTFCRPATVFLSLLALDIASHWFQIYRYCLSTGSVDLFFLLKLVIVPYINYVLQFFYIIILCLWNWKYFFVFIVDIDCEDIITMPVFHFFFLKVLFVSCGVFPNIFWAKLRIFKFFKNSFFWGAGFIIVRIPNLKHPCKPRTFHYVQNGLNSKQEKILSGPIQTLTALIFHY